MGTDFFYEYNGWGYRREDDSDEDRCRSNHYAVHLETGEELQIDHTGYEGISEEAFRAHVRLSFPARPKPTDITCASVPWRNETIVEKANDLVG